MTRWIRYQALITMFAVCLSILCWRVQSVSAQAQKGAAPPPQKGEEIPPDSDYMFRKYSAVLDDIKAKETDPQRRADALIAWVKGNPKATRAIAYAASFYGEVVAAALKSDPQKALAMIQAFQAAAPADTTLVSLEMSAYYQAKNYAKAAEIGEKLYADKPNVNMAETLYTIYAQMNNPDKVLVYGEKLIAEIPIDKSFGIVLNLAQIYSQRKNTDKVLSLYSKLMDAYGDKVPAGVKEGDWNTVRASAFSMMAADSYNKKDFAKAMDLYDKVTKFAPATDDIACTAWYYIGMAKWQNKDQKGAIEPMAKCYVIGKTSSPKAKEYLDLLYKNEHSGSLDGLDAVLAKAKSDLGIK